MEKIARDLQQAQKQNSYLFSSRCIANYAEIVKATVQKLQEQGLKPFLFPTMGSHGSSYEGQKKILEHYGVTEKDMGVPIQSSIGSSGAISPEQLRMIRIKNTASLGVVEVSDAYQNELSKRADLELIDESRPLAFDVNWNLTPF